jgi:hypothetical protein
MTTNLLDKNPGSRRYVAHLHSFGATRAQICAKLAQKFPMAAPTPRSMTKWLNGDRELVKMIAELEAIKAEMAPDDATLAELPEPVDMAQATADLWCLLDEFPAYAMLLLRVEHDPDFDDDDAPRRVLLETPAEELEAACAALVGDWDYHEAMGAEPGYKERVAAVMAAA